MKTPDQANDGAIDSVRGVVDSLERAATGEKTSMREVVESLGEASFVPVLMAPALAVVTPLSGIPLFSSLCGLLIALVSVQMLLNRDHLWLPDWLMRRTVETEKLTKGIGYMKKPADFLDRWTKERLSFLVKKPFNWITELACLICGSVMPLLEFVPFSSSIIGAAVVLFSLSLLVRDGLFALFAFFFIAGGITLIIRLVG
ncbi:exopolysaccharide biosynthesis protein [Pelagovum pacificum]|uniref:Exopolysaccharide biosynthesis protein n=1 Tax=Pelagovum pacificum TaxID=2588711 RepID=A0A5C5G7G0_9RHOB|nr:exopolysaccharide biosynthesis protein [Pelagovum pacificum]QQA41911.1 exopolysaccharide biosynthesis protein [Pelagovum pacificum]TNY30649.1 exopolysaccharide biosynthesis protein [Pelagovum pacificum]